MIFWTGDLTFYLVIFFELFKIGPETVFCKVSNVLMNRNWSVLNFMLNGRVLVFGSDLSLVRKVGSLQLVSEPKF